MALAKVGRELALKPRVILNPGSVGQPRDRDPRAAYAIFNSDQATWQPCRAEYDIESVQQRVREAGLPEKHAVRLAEGW
jgi:diadenosine tetraphosphatase ApaH/serine/threonine PP2A family protein phosphatase